jgi:hypothetical protein
MSRRRAPGRDRTHVTPGRPRAILLRYTEEEYGEVADAARCAGLTPSGFAAEAALASASGRAGPALRPERAALTELVRARVQVRKLGTNVNQAARQLNAMGESPPWLEQAVSAATRAVAELEAAAMAMTSVAGRRSADSQRTSARVAATATATSPQRPTVVPERSRCRTAQAVVRAGMTGQLASQGDAVTSIAPGAPPAPTDQGIAAGVEGGEA